MGNIERLAQYNTYQENHLGFKGIIAGVADELIPDGYVPDMENLKITVEGIAEAVKTPEYIVPPTGETDLKNIFVWYRDDGSTVTLAQYGAKLYKWSGTAWTVILKGGGNAFASTKKCSFAAGMSDKVYIAQEDTQVMSYDGTTLATLPNGPKGRYITLWKNRLFVGYIKSFYGQSTSSTTSGTETTSVSGSALQSAVLWSNINLAEVLHNTDAAHYDNGWSTFSLIELRTPENSECTGILPAGENLILFTKSGAFTFSGYSESNFNSFDYYHGVNTPKNNAVISVGGVYYIADDGFFSFAKEPKLISDAVKPIIDPSSSNVSCAYFDGRIWFITGYTLVALNMGNGSWEKYQFGKFLYGSTDVGQQNLVYATPDHMYIGTTLGYILEIDVPSTVASGYRPWYLKTPVLNQGITSDQKRYKSVFIYARNSNDVLNASFSVDYGEEIGIIPAISGTMKTGTGVWGTMLWGTGTWSSEDEHIKIYKRFMVCPLARTVRFSFYGTGEGALLGYGIVYTPKRKLGVR